MRTRGFSLIELLVGVAVSVIVVAAAVALLTGTQRSFQGGVDDRAMQETARVAMDELTTNLAQAGYGMEPTLVFDFGQAATIQDEVPTGDQVRFGGYNCTAPVNCRDSIAGPDEVVFYSRDPLWEKDLTGIVGVNSITLVGPIASPLQQGQVLQVMCYGTNDQWLWAFVTVQSADATNPSAIQVSLAPSPGLPFDFPYQNSLLTQPCFGSGTRRAFKIDRYRYYIQAVDGAGNPQAWETPGTRPYLMLDQGLASSPAAIAADVEDLQVAYVFPLAAAGSQLIGATAGTAVAEGANGIDLAPALGIPSFSTPSLDPTRTTNHPANIQAVRVAITVRSERSDLTCTDPACTQLPASLNRPAWPGEPGYKRMVFDATTYVHNMMTRLAVFPTYDPSYNLPTCADNAGNCGGG